MKLFAVALLFFLLAFAGLAIGLIVRRKGLRSGCGHTTGTDHDCRCESELDASMRGRGDCENQNCLDKNQDSE